jgi:O-antigen/teichoic acid export membrane protein
MPLQDSLTVRTARAAQWRFAGSVIGAASQFVVGVLLARLLSPANFGVIGLAFVVLGFARVCGDLGVSVAVVQRAHLTDRHIRVAFTFATMLGLAVAAVMIIGAPLGAALMQDRQVTSVLRALALGSAIGGTSAVAGALLRRDLKFKHQFFIDTGSYLLGYGCIAVALALRGYALWSLVWGNLVQTLVASAAQLMIVGHPMRPLFSRPELRDLIRFGLPVHLSGCANYFALNGDNFVVGRWMGAASLGLYSRAYTLMNLPFTYAASVMSGVLFPVFAQVQAEPARLQRAFLVATQLTAMIAASGTVTLAVVAPYLVPTLYGTRWAGVVVPLRILCIAGYFRALYHLGGVVAQSVGRVYIELRNQVVYAALVIAGAAIGSRHGLGGVAAGVAVAIAYMFAATGQLALQAVGGSWGQYFRAQAPAIVTAVFTSGAALAIRFVLEARGASSGVITVATLLGAAVPFGIGLLWSLGEPGFDPLRALLPASGQRLVAAVRRRGRLAEIQT